MTITECVKSIWKESPGSSIWLLFCSEKEFGKLELEDPETQEKLKKLLKASLKLFWGKGSLTTEDVHRLPNYQPNPRGYGQWGRWAAAFMYGRLLEIAIQEEIFIHGSKGFSPSLWELVTQKGEG